MTIPEQPWGERRYVRNHYKELRVELVQKTLDNRRMALVFRVFDDGVGFRYEFPSSAVAGNAHQR
jgi:alpha-glucosidase